MRDKDYKPFIILGVILLLIIRIGFLTINESRVRDNFCYSKHGIDSLYSKGSNYIVCAYVINNELKEAIYSNNVYKPWKKNNCDIPKDFNYLDWSYKCNLKGK